MSREDTPTAHIAAQYDDIAKTVIMCGDPLRAKFIAEKYLESPKLFNEVRGMLGYVRRPSPCQVHCREVSGKSQTL